LTWCDFSAGVVNLENGEKLGLVMNLKVRRTGRRTYINLPDSDVNICRIGPGDILKIKIIEVRRLEEEEPDLHGSAKVCKEGKRR